MLHLDKLLPRVHLVWLALPIATGHLDSLGLTDHILPGRHVPAPLLEKSDEKEDGYYEGDNADHSADHSAGYGTSRNGLRCCART